MQSAVTDGNPVITPTHSAADITPYAFLAGRQSKGLAITLAMSIYSSVSTISMVELCGLGLRRGEILGSTTEPVFVVLRKPYNDQGYDYDYCSDNSSTADLWLFTE